MGVIHFFSEETSFSLSNEKSTLDWLKNIASTENQQISEINYIFCSDDYLLQINKEYLNHDYYTDIITFDNRDETGNPIEADIFISIDRVEENAKIENTSFEQELHRVLAHGLLHLIGYNDKTIEQKEVMREKEEACLSLQKF